MKVGIIGSGDVARVLATGFLATGHEVLIGARTPQKEELQEWLRTAGPKGKVGTYGDAAKYADLAVVCTLGAVAEEVLRSIGPDELAGKTVIDTTNALKRVEGAPPQLFVGFTDSLGERIQRVLPESHVVKSFNIVGSPHMYRPTFPGGPPDMFICGNDVRAKETVTQILNDFGWPSVIDIGGIEGARYLEPLGVLWVTSGIRLGSWNIAFKLLRK